MSPEFTAFIHVSRAPAEVYEAVADPEMLSRYFATGGAVGRLETGKTVQWDFHDFPGAFPVEVLAAVPPALIRIVWGANDGSGKKTDVSITFAAVDDGRRTKVSIHETGWSDDEAGRKASYGNCMGWSQMLAALKAWLEYGINLRDGAYK